MFLQATNFINKIIELYQSDPFEYNNSTHGDGFIYPLHRAIEAINLSLNPIIDNGPSVKNVATCVTLFTIGSLIFFPAVFSAGIGITLKSFQENPNPIIEPDPNFSLDAIYIPKEILLHIIKPLKLIEKIKLSEVSNMFNNLLVDSPILWHSFLIKKKIQQTNHWCEKCPSDDTLQIVRNKDDSFKQVKSYLKIGPNNFNLFACNLKGGPAAYIKIPYLKFPSLSDIQLSKLSASIIRGSYSSIFFERTEFIAFCVQNLKDNKPTVLIFSDFLSKIPHQLKNDCYDWHTINLNIPNHLKYILAIANREDLTERGSEFDEILDLTLRLV